MAKHIGIVASSCEGAALCYRRICQAAAQRMGPYRHPEISLHNLPLADYVDAINEGAWERIGDMMLHSARRLAAAGADFVITPDNTLHHAQPHAAAGLPIPWLSMIELVADRIAADEHKAVGLLGTRFVMSGSAYQSILGLRGIPVFIPNDERIAKLDRIIFDELVYGILKQESRDLYVEAIEDFEQRGCSAVILGGTELPLLVRQEDSSLAMYDSTSILALAALEFALAEG
ncbi:MAG: amino acid racemase [Phycisphaerales bacterium]|nr:amino acid racemase [Phycisphaerales bacterium]